MINREVHFRIKEIQVDRNELGHILKKNKEKHVSDYKESYSKFLEHCESVLKRHQKDFEELIDHNPLNDNEVHDSDWLYNLRNGLAEFKLPREPVSYEKEYDKAIRMVELSTESNLTLDDQQFEQLVLDQWSWTERFTETSAFYKNVK